MTSLRLLQVPHEIISKGFILISSLVQNQVNIGCIPGAIFICVMFFSTIYTCFVGCSSSHVLYVNMPTYTIQNPFSFKNVCLVCTISRKYLLSIDSSVLTSSMNSIFTISNQRTRLFYTIFQIFILLYFFMVLLSYNVQIYKLAY